MADSLDSGSSAHSGRAGSTPASRTKKESPETVTFRGILLYLQGLRVVGYCNILRDIRSILQFYCTSLQKIADGIANELDQPKQARHHQNDISRADVVAVCPVLHSPKRYTEFA